LRIRIPMGLVTAVALAVIAIVVVLRLGRSALLWTTASAVAVFVLTAYLITAGQSAGSHYRVGQAHLPRPAYGRMFDGWSQRHRDAFIVASELHHIVPKAAHPGIPVLSWVPRDWSYVVSLSAAQYGWAPHAIRDLPRLHPADVARVRSERPDVVLVMSSRRAD